jgi:hypothetical protein
MTLGEGVSPRRNLDYCDGHVEALTLLAMLPGIDLPRALLLRGRFIAAPPRPPRPGPLLNRPLGDNCSQRGGPSQANAGPKNQGRSGCLGFANSNWITVRSMIRQNLIW